MAFFQLIFKYRRIIWELTYYQMAEHNAGSLGGFAWEIIHPLFKVLILWFVFSMGFKATGPEGIPFMPYFISGMLPWITFAEVFNSGAGAVVANSHLVRKTIFPVEVLPAVYLSASLVRHVILLVMVIGVMAYHRLTFSWTILQIPYYFGGMAFLLLGLSWMTSALNIFNRDIGQIVRIFTEIWFWATPVVWAVDRVPKNWQWLLKLNPMYFVIKGYRDSLLFQGVFWRDGWTAAYFWLLVTGIALLGAHIFGKLKPMFADEIH